VIEPIGSGTAGPITRCPNCGSDFAAEYCARCGQNQREARISLRQWLEQSLAESLSLDGRLLQSLRVLLTRPGALSREWSEGRRIRYVHPLRLYLAALAAFFGISFAFGFPTELLPESGTLRGSGIPQYDAAIRAFQNEVRLILTVLILAAVPLLAVSLRILFRRGWFFLEHLVFSLHVAAFALLVLTAAWAAPFAGRLGTYAAMALLALPPIYLWLAMRRAYGGPVVAAGARTAMVAAVFVAAALGSAAMFGQPVGNRLGAVMVLVDDGLRQRADRLYREWADADAAGETARAAALLPQAMAAENQVRFNLTVHQRYHRARLRLALGDAAAALDVARAILEEAPTELLALGVAADAALELGDPEAAAAFHARFLELYPEHHEAQRDAHGHARDLARYAELSGIQ
jgi:hypothetical protein